MLIVTSGAPYIDIDAYACCIAYAELLNLIDKPALAVSTAVWNESITKSLRALGDPLRTTYNTSTADQFILVDVSSPDQFDGIVDITRVREVVDHHSGLEKFWLEKIGAGCCIDFIGAAATLIYERWDEEHQLKQMSKASAQLLAAAILDNTLNFNAGVTTKRDRAAYDFLASHAGVGDTWAANYFIECQEAITADLSTAIRNDTKNLKFNGLEDELCFGQIVVWEADDVITNQLDTIASVLGAMQKIWLANVVNISEGKSYFITPNEQVQRWLGQLLQLNFTGSIAGAERLWLRKEIMKLALER